MTVDGNEDLIADYLGEAHDYLEQLNGILMELAEGEVAWPAEQVNELFRSAHSLKGLSACFGFETTNRVTHHLESLLCKIRDGELRPTTPVCRTMFDAIDLISSLTAEVAAGGQEVASSELVLADLERACSGQLASGANAEDGAKGAGVAKGAPRPAGNQPAMSEANETVRVRMERLDRMVNLTGELVIARSRFQLVARQLAPLAQLDDVSRHWRDVEAGLADLREVECSDESSASRPGGEKLNSVVARLEGALLRVQNCFEELVGVGRSMRDLDDVAYDLDSVAGGIHEAVLQLRMVPLDSVFKRLQRVARDTAESLGKPVDFEVQGGETQIDKRVADELINPLVHMLRNSIDHGIEGEAAREAAGKPARGVVRVCGSQRGSTVVIDLEDDGGGIDPERMRRKVVELELMSESDAAQLPDREAQKQIFHPGFSTAAEVTEVSGRGMGMDIVAATIKGLRGSLELDSRVGSGSRFTVQLPPSMSILASLLLEVRGTMFALPLTEVREIVELRKVCVRSVQSRPVVVVREQPMPFVQLPMTYRFAQQADPGDVREPEHAIVFGNQGEEVALGVDRIVGKEDLVIKPLCAELTGIAGLAGMAIRGDGKVTLILDPNGFADFAMKRQGMSSMATNPPALV
ncbi:MAG: chemotaxis protein CheA [Planctomycetota bacterium]